MYTKYETCKKCGKDTEIYFGNEIIYNSSNEAYCASCFSSEHPCNNCGDVAESGIDFINKFIAFENKWYCDNCALSVYDDLVKITSTQHIEGYYIEKYLGIDSVEIVIGTGWFSEFTGEITDRLGIRSSQFEQKLQRAKTTAVYLFKKKAFELGANAILGTDLDFTEFSGNRIALMINGTLVIIEKRDKELH